MGITEPVMAQSATKTGPCKEDVQSPVTVSNVEHTTTNETNPEFETGEQYDINTPTDYVGEQMYSKVSVYLSLLFSGLAMGADGYNASVVGNVSLILTVLYPDTLSAGIWARLSNSFLIGMILGMLSLGVVVDQFGRKTGAVITTLVLSIGIILSTAASGTSPLGLLWMLIVSRGIAGVGAGGEYPVVGATTVEATNEASMYRKRRAFILAVVGELNASMGYIWGALVPLLLLLCTNQKESHYELVWRLAFGLGLLPPLGIFYFRMRMAVSSSYRKSALRKQRTPYLLLGRKYWRRIFAASSTWFLANWISIPFAIFSSTIVSRVTSGDSLVSQLGWGTLINCFYLPGPFIGGWLADKIGRRQTMTLGFTLQATIGFILSGAYQQIQTIFPLFIILYGLFLTMGEIGPGSTLLTVSTEPFPTSVRGHIMGLIAAIAKAGAAIGTQVFTGILSSYTDRDQANRTAFFVGSSLALLGALIAWFVLEDVDRELDNEDERWKKYLTEHGWVGASWGDHVSRDPEGVLQHALTRRS